MDWVVYGCSIWLNVKELIYLLAVGRPKGNPKPCHKIGMPATSWHAMRLSQWHFRTPVPREPGPPLENRKPPHVRAV